MKTFHHIFFMHKNYFILKYFFIAFIFCLPIKSFSQSGSPHPNILLIMVDDMKWNSISIMDSTYPLLTPNIDRIGNEGANINYYSTNSICVPGRTALLTGRYGHRNGVMNNTTAVTNAQLTLPKTLHDSGYYTALIGKWMVNTSNPNPLYDYWLCAPSGAGYMNVNCDYGNLTYPTTGHLTDILTDSAVQLISRIDTPFFMMLDHNAPHAPWIGQPQFDGDYNNTNFQHPENYARYTKDYPSYLYADSTKVLHSDSQFQLCMRNYTELMKGIDSSTGLILDALTSRGLLDNTMIIFTTDNGFLIGEHKITDKYKPYEDCMKMPLLIRYPAWFPPGTVMNDDFALNIDVTPTIFDAVNFSSPVTYPFDGISVHDLFSGTSERNKFLYEQAPPDSANPVLRSFRDEQFQYTRYYCLDTTEELFDMQYDSYQLLNLARDTNFQTILYQYRIKLDSVMLATDDTASFPLFPCYLKTDSPAFFSDSMSVNICSNEIYDFNGDTVNTPGIYIDTFTVALGFDSLEILHLNVFPTYDDDTITATICPNENYSFNGMQLDVSGIYTGNFNSINGCDSVVVLDLTVDDLNVSIQRFGDTLIAHGNGFIQWKRCNGDTISGATDSVFIVTVSGSYAAIFNDGICIDTTNCKYVGINGIENEEDENQFTIYPNPVNNILNVSCTDFFNAEIEIRNTLGELLFSENLKKENTKIDLSSFTSGIYFISIRGNDFFGMKKIFKAR